MCGEFARSSSHIKPPARVAAWRDADSLDRPEKAAQAMYVGAGAENPWRLVDLIDIRIGLEMRDQLGVDVDRVANAPVARRLSRPIDHRRQIDDWPRMRGAPQIRRLRRCDDRQRRKDGEHQDRKGPHYRRSRKAKASLERS